MRQVLVRATMLTIAAMLSVSPTMLRAQMPTTTRGVDQPAPLYSARQLDQLLAPIALYPDQLLSQILMAATYPLEVVEAARWVQVPSNAALRGNRLALALDQMDWDPSVKALVPFPRILQMMNDELGWMQRLGDAFLAQEGEVMDSVQRLRHQAAAAGTLASTQQQVVVTQGPDIIVQSATPDMVYVPYYDPTVAYGIWPYPAYPPYFFPPPPGYVYYGAGLYFGIGVVVIESFWGWSSWDWVHHFIRINIVQYNRINRREIERHRTVAVQGDRWEHNPYHRRGVPYRSVVNRERFGRPPSEAAERRRVFRGYESFQAPAPRSQPSVRNETRPSRPTTATRPSIAPKPTAPTPRAAQKITPRQTAPKTRSTPQASAPQRTPSTRQPAKRMSPQPTSQTRTSPASQRRAPPAFEGISRGGDVRAQSRRGWTSERAVAPSSRSQVRPQVKAPATRSRSRERTGDGRSNKDTSPQDDRRHR